MTLGLNRIDSGIAFRMMTSAHTLPGYEIVALLGPVEGAVELSFSAASIGGLGVVTGGGLENAMFDAKTKLSLEAKGVGADAVIGFTYVVAGRPFEKSVLAYGTAVKCRKLET